MVTKIAIPGGPLSGKDACQSYLLQKFGDYGYYPMYVTEAATLHMAGNLKPDKFSVKTFQRTIIDTMKHLEDSAERAVIESEHPKPLIFCNRGIPDCITYAKPYELYCEILNELGLGTDIEVRDKRYKAAIFLRSLAYDKPELYEQLKFNNPHRLEATSRDAKKADEETLQAWVGHPHLRSIDNSTDWAGKLKRLEQEICAVLGIPIPLEIEKKYLCDPVNIADIPVPVQTVEIEQLYLYSTDPNTVLRVRKRGQYGKYVYFLTAKRDLKEGVREEVERTISKEQYEWSTQFILTGTRPVRKLRHCFMYENQYFELDSIPLSNGRILQLLEIELTREAQQPRLPPFINRRSDVTNDPHYTNRAIAVDGWRP